MALDAAINALGGGKPARVPLPTITTTPAEDAEIDADLKSPESRAALEKELGRKDLHPVARNILQKEFDTQFGGKAQSSQAPANDDTLTGAIDALTKATTTTSAPRRDPTVPPDFSEQPMGAPSPETQGQRQARELSEGSRQGSRLLTRPWGPVEAAGTIASGALAAPVAAAAGLYRGVTGGKYGTPEGAREAQARAAEVLHSLTYEPRTEAGRETLDTLGRTMEQTGLNKLAGLGPSEAMALGNVSQRPMLPKLEGGVVPSVAAGGAKASVGAAGATLKSQAEALVANASPELQDAAKRVKEWTPYALKTLERYVDADTLPVKMKVMTGQASDNPTLMSKQFNAKGVDPKTADLLKEQNRLLKENVTAIRDNAAPDVYVHTPGALSETVIESYRKRLAAARQETSIAYKSLEDANGGAFPMDAKAFVSAADEALKKKLKSEFVPAPLEKQLERFRTGEPMNFEQFEAMRTNLANIARSQADGNVKQAAALIRNALEEMPMASGAEKLKGLADKARALARKEHAAIEAEPAMKDVARGKALPDGFLDKHVLRGDTSKVALMSETLANDPVAKQAISAHLIERLKGAARIVGEDGVFNQAGYNKMLAELHPKLKVLLPPEQLADLEKLGRVAKMVKGQDAGTFFNNSNSWIAALGDIAKDTATSAIPGGRIIREIGKNIQARRSFNKAMQTGEGLKLKEVGR